MEEHMRGIGDMARATGLSVSALRFYDGAGVLVPARVDRETGYRWYAEEQVLRGRLVARLRRVGMPLVDLCRVLEHWPDRATVDDLLDAHLRRLEACLDDARRELSAARALLDDLERPMTAPPTITRLTLRGRDLAAALRAVRYAVSADPELPMLHGVLLELDEGGLTAAATDRYRLAVRAAQAQELVGPPVGVVAPVALVEDVVRSLAEQEGQVHVVVAGDELTIEAGPARLSGQRLDVDFPDYRRLLRTGTGYRIPVQVAALRRQLVATPTRVVRREEDGTDHEVTVLTVDADGALGFGEDPGAGSADLVIGVNGEFLLQAVDAIGAGQLVLELDGPVSPLALRDPMRPTDVDLLMPVRLV